MTLRDAMQLGQQTEKVIKQLSTLSLLANPPDNTAVCMPLSTYCGEVIENFNRLMNQSLFRELNR